MRRSNKKSKNGMLVIIIIMLIFFPFIGSIEGYARFYITKVQLINILNKPDDSQTKKLEELIDGDSTTTFIYKNSKSRILFTTIEANSVESAGDIIANHQIAAKEVFEVNTGDNMYTVLLATYLRLNLWLYIPYTLITAFVILSFIKRIKKHVKSLHQPIYECVEPPFQEIDQLLSKRYLAYMDLTIDDIQMIMKHLHQSYTQDDIIQFIEHADHRLIKVKHQVSDLDHLVTDADEIMEVDLVQVILVVMASFKASQSQPPEYRLYANKLLPVMLNYTMIQRLLFILVHLNQFQVAYQKQCDFEIKLEQQKLIIFIKSRKDLLYYDELNWIEDALNNDKMNAIEEHELAIFIHALCLIKAYFKAECVCKNRVGVFELTFSIDLSNKQIELQKELTK